MKTLIDIALVILGFATLFCVIFGASLESNNPFGGIAAGIMLLQILLILVTTHQKENTRK